jgi:hypothetical protein
MAAIADLTIPPNVHSPRSTREQMHFATKFRQMVVQISREPFECLR